ncbi:hypothetical protein BJ508DRAFT_413447 [Ascobolus immersus RN42]|uniref:Uncharacterized protein n=1 Tax=Ascobolus immersus RN42 TaxID=1160509 RepID=A0A3N4IBN2_ASCIM|nr:hypothetical protein BJ508DRAFT_413447 [Ascobolus immersus RN42]
MWTARWLSGLKRQIRTFSVGKYDNLLSSGCAGSNPALVGVSFWAFGFFAEFGFVDLFTLSTSWIGGST